MQGTHTIQYLAKAIKLQGLCHKFSIVGGAYRKFLGWAQGKEKSVCVERLSICCAAGAELLHLIFSGYFFLFVMLFLPNHF